MPVTLGPNGQDPAGGWGLNVGKFIRHYRAWVIRGTANGFTAQRRNAKGQAAGRVLEAPTLDELAALIEAAERSAPPP